MDFEGFEEHLKKDPSISLFLLCNPHNPTGNCYTLAEIERIIAICDRYHVWVISDEIHADIVMPNQHHVSALKCDASYHDHLIVLGSPTKTFNLAGLKISYAIIKITPCKQSLRRKQKQAAFPASIFLALRRLFVRIGKENNGIKHAVLIFMRIFSF